LSVLLLDVTNPASSAALAHESAALAHELGLKKVGGRPPLGAYIVQVWNRRHFAFSLARGKAYSKNQGSYLGQLWAILTPLLWALLYFSVFKYLLHVNRGIENYAGFVVTALFIFRFISGTMNRAANSMEHNNGLITSLQFPRALIPIAYATAEFLILLPALLVLLAVAFLNHEPLRWQILLLGPAVLLAYGFATGVAFFSARLVVEVADLGNLIPFVNRALMYASGVLFTLDRYGDGVLFHVMTYQPLAVYIQLGRSALLEEVPVEPVMWLCGLGWAALAVATGFIFFWRAEAKYGRG